HPEEEMRRLCACLGEDFEPRMINPRRSVESLSVPGEWWKDRARTPIDPSGCFAWKRTLSPEDRITVDIICQEGLDHYGYERTADAMRTHEVYTLDSWSVRAYEGRLRRAALCGMRFLPLRYEDVPVDRHPASWSGPLVFLGDSIPGREPAERWRDLRRLARTL